MWSREETDQLFDPCEQFDLRFIVIADRFPTDRSVEESKSRYYSVTRTLLIARAQSFDEVAKNPLVKRIYNAAYETERKRALSAVLTMSKKQESKDAENVDEVGLPINSDNTKEKALVPAEGLSPLDNTRPSSSTATRKATAPNSPIPASLHQLHMYSRSHALDQMVQAARVTAGVRTVKMIDQALQDLGVNLKPNVPTKAVCADHLELRNEIFTLLNLQKQLQNKEAESSANQGSLFADAPGTPKHSNRDDDQPFLPEFTGFRGERVSKQDHEHKCRDTPVWAVNMPKSIRQQS